MRRVSLVLFGCICGLSLLVGCDGSQPSTTVATATVANSSFVSSVTAPAGKTAAATALAFVTAWSAQDAGALEELLTPDTRTAWGLGGGMSKWLADQRGGYASPLPGQGRALAVEENGASGSADVAVAYPCPGCGGYRLPD